MHVRLSLIVPDCFYFLIWISNHKISVLFHSPLKVLFSFPSQYLFTIGLWLIFRISRNLPALLNSNLKEFDSLYWKVCYCTNATANRCTGLSPFLAVFSNNTWPIGGAVPLQYVKLQFSPSINVTHVAQRMKQICRFKICSLVPISFAITNGITVVFFSLA